MSLEISKSYIVYVLETIFTPQKVYKFSEGDLSQGVSDVLICHHSNSFWCKIKIDEKELTVSQLDFLMKFRTGFLMYIDEENNRISIYLNQEVPYQLKDIVNKLSYSTGDNWKIEHKHLVELESVGFILK